MVVAAGAPTFVAGVDLGGTWLRVGLAGPDGIVRRRGRARTAASEGPTGILAQIDGLVREAVAAEPEASLSQLLLAVGVPGPVDSGTGVVAGAPNLPGWRGVPLRELLEKRLGCRCLVEHDASLAALAEYRRGTGRGTQDFVYVTVSTGIGAGLILGGRLYRGYQGSAGEFGHMVIFPGGPACNCGNRGCLEALASGTAIAREAGVASAFEVSRMASAGDPAARAILSRAARYIGLALGGLINLLNPEAVALGGGVVASSPDFWSEIMGSLGEASLPSVRGSCRVERAALGEDQGLLGAVEFGLDHWGDRLTPTPEVAVG
ncbi:MAG TPA: ROK family protein [Candidatus Dormibacteraeota bacterium]|nr:ROK family protein [Candidatus Dormibacteraeota bacterium]